MELLDQTFWVQLHPSFFNRQMQYELGVISSLFVLCVIYFSISSRGASKLPLVNPKKWFELSKSRIKEEFIAQAPYILEKGFVLSGDKPFRINADIGEVTVLPPEYANEIRNDERLSFARYMYRNFHAHLPGFEAFIEGGRDSRLVKFVSQQQLTVILNQITKPLSDETGLTLKDVLGDNDSWHNIALKEEMLHVVARLSSRVMLGEELCRDERWLHVTVRYTEVAFQAAQYLRIFPYFIRPVLHWFLPQCRQARSLVRSAREIIHPALEQRRIMKMLQGPGKEIKFNDGFEWFEQAAKGKPYDPAISQLMMSFSAIHTSADLAVQVLLDIAGNPDIIGPMREEIIRVVSEHGWRKTSLYNLKLMDSVLKESQRLKPVLSAAMRRVATSDVELSDGTVIKKNAMVAVSARRHWDPQVYPDPDKWDGFRFLHMRRTEGQEHVAQLVSTSPSHLGFGHGLHACPGRFFAANELKVLLCHLLLKYDISMVDGYVPKPAVSGFHVNADPGAQLCIRRRQEEIDLSDV
ncbi:putative trichothecene C-8 hydroxylase [Rosellinia necatrix]|uniref:Putative trichothecene C-8 hydroxylase n=1 Tax=Rosellinia necatrix TaxID=77044 RepID=A0A1W2TQE3_ROSNE|nr:putative trichothecene C-8 hydroxylase [Rosellinia necatrix]